LTSALTLALNAAGVGDFLSGMVTSFSLAWQLLQPS